MLYAAADSEPTATWKDLLEQTLERYNNHCYSTIKMKPIEAKTLQRHYDIQHAPPTPKRLPIVDGIQIEKMVNEQVQKAADKAIECHSNAKEIIKFQPELARFRMKQTQKKGGKEFPYV